MCPTIMNPTYNTNRNLNICKVELGNQLRIMGTWRMEKVEEDEEGLCDQGALPAGSGMTNGELSRLSIVCPPACTHLYPNFQTLHILFMLHIWHILHIFPD